MRSAAEAKYRKVLQSFAKQGQGKDCAAKAKQSKDWQRRSNARFALTGKGRDGL